MSNMTEQQKVACHAIIHSAALGAGQAILRQFQVQALLLI